MSTQLNPPQSPPNIIHPSATQSSPLPTSHVQRAHHNYILYARRVNDNSSYHLNRGGDSSYYHVQRGHGEPSKKSKK